MKKQITCVLVLFSFFSSVVHVNAESNQIQETKVKIRARDFVTACSKSISMNFIGFSPNSQTENYASVKLSLGCLGEDYFPPNPESTSYRISVTCKDSTKGTLTRSGVVSWDYETGYGFFGFEDLSPQTKYSKCQFTLSSSELSKSLASSFSNLPCPNTPIEDVITQDNCDEEITTLAVPKVTCDVLSLSAFFALQRVYEGLLSPNLEYSYCDQTWKKMSTQPHTNEEDYAMIVYSSTSETAVLAIRGTSTTSLTDITSNLCDPSDYVEDDVYHKCSDFPQYFPKGCDGGSVRCNYFDDFERAFGWATNAINQIRSNGLSRLVVTGHSQGAGITSILGFSLRSIYTDIEVLVIYYASPSVGDDDFVDYFKSQLYKKNVALGFRNYAEGLLDKVSDPVPGLFSSDDNDLQPYCSLDTGNTDCLEDEICTFVTLHPASFYFENVYVSKDGDARKCTSRSSPILASVSTVPNVNSPPPPSAPSATASTPVSSSPLSSTVANSPVSYTTSNSPISNTNSNSPISSTNSNSPISSTNSNSPITTFSVSLSPTFFSSVTIPTQSSLVSDFSNARANSLEISVMFICVLLILYIGEIQLI